MDAKTPINKSAAIFLSRKPRVETIQEATEIFAVKITSPDVAAQVKQMMENHQAGDDIEVVVTIKIRPDLRDNRKFAVTMDSKLVKQIESMTFLGLI